VKKKAAHFVYNKTPNFIWVLLFAPVFMFTACKTSSKHKQVKSNFLWDTAAFDVKPEPEYRASAKRINDIIHTKLDLKFDWINAQVIGKATITFKPYFYPANTLELDAVGFEIKEVAHLVNGKKNALLFDYNAEKLLIKLGKTYSKNDTLSIFIDYIAKPNNTVDKGSESIVNDKGLYFINKDGADRLKPQQIWSQGETKANSKWFPTIDEPNERMTQEIYLTVDKKFVTLSNGLLISQTENTDGTRTDYWKQSLGAAPYLTMIAVGNFAIVKDKWKNKEVSYYVEPAYAKYAKAIFGNTPEMMTFYSDVLGVDFPWEKYAQITVRDYVSGAMENTTATVHGEDMQRTDRELLDDDGESIIAHELFHHWFGDMVTCESWSNLPLNESFATYAEYLWILHKYGKDAADYHLDKDLENYLLESKTKRVNMIRFYYQDREDMFDSHSYAKGGRILRMLHNYVGDDAFFASLKLYLETKKFDSAEIEDLRLAFEKVTGEDLNWFFNQWFKSSGHPELLIEHQYNEVEKKYELTVSQKQNFNVSPLYKLPVKVTIYYKNKQQNQSIVITKEKETFTFEAAEKPELVVFDSDRVLLCTREEKRSEKEWIFQYKHAPLYYDRMEAIINLSKLKSTAVFDVLVKACNDKYDQIRVQAINNMATYHIKENPQQLKTLFLNLATKDEKSIVRATALQALTKLGKDQVDYKSIYELTLNDKSFLVQSTALNLIYKNDPDLGFELAKKFEKDTNINIVSEVGEIFARAGTDAESEYFATNFERIGGFDKYEFIDLYGKYLLGKNDATINKGVALLGREARENTIWFIRLNAVNKLNQLSDMYAAQERETKGNNDKKIIHENAQNQKEKIILLVNDIKKSETNKNLIDIYRN
jgi:aminopeptidase N